MRSDPTGQAALRRYEQTLPSNTIALYCRLTASISGESLEVKKVGEERDRCVISSSVIALTGPGSMTALGSSVDMSSSARLEAHPVHADAARSHMKAVQAT